MSSQKTEGSMKEKVANEQHDAIFACELRRGVPRASFEMLKLLITAQILVNFTKKGNKQLYSALMTLNFSTKRSSASYYAFGPTI